MYSLILVSVLTWQALVFAQIDETEVALVCEFEVSFQVYNYRLLVRWSLALLSRESIPEFSVISFKISLKICLYLSLFLSLSLSLSLSISLSQSLCSLSFCSHFYHTLKLIGLIQFSTGIPPQIPLPLPLTIWRPWCVHRIEKLSEILWVTCHWWGWRGDYQADGQTSMWCPRLFWRATF